MPVFIYTPDQIQRIGLKLFGVDRYRQKKQSAKSNLEDFECLYCVDPCVLAQMWEDLQTTSIDDARIDAKSPTNMNSGCNIKNFLRAFHFVMRYQTDGERKISTGNSKTTVRKWTWFFLEKIAALRGLKIVWRQNWSTNFIISIDGVHCKFPEPKHPTLSQDPSFYSHKYDGAGLAYELALDLFESKLVWLKGPLPAGANSDLKMYQSELKNKIPDGKVAVTDGGYGDFQDPKLAQPNTHDSDQLRTFKARARMRQEAFHSRLRRFNCLTDAFRHGMDRHGTCFVAVAVICAYEMDLVSPMWDL